VGIGTSLKKQLANLFLLLNKGGLLLVLLISIKAFAGGGLRGEIRGFKLNSCGIKNCLVIRADRAFSGILSSSYAFDSAQIEVIEKQTDKKTIFDSNDAFYDGVTGKIFIRSIEQSRNTEVIYDLKTEEISYLPFATK
jgi:hypothetical protein